MADGDVAELGLSGNELIIAIAKERFQRCRDWESEAQARYQQDMKFANADPVNGWQWPGYLWNQRKDDPNGYKPRLTVNKVRQHNLQIKNDARQNKPGIKISPVGNEATFKAAQAWMNLMRDIERRSKATEAYDSAVSTQVDGGIGYLRVVTDYTDNDSFDQEIYIKRVKDPLNVFIDPDCMEVDYSDARFAFVFEDMPRSEFLAEYPDMRGKLAVSVLGDQNGWLDENHVRVVEYFAKKQKKDRLVLMLDPTKNPDDPENRIIARWSKIPAAIKREIDPDTILQSRDILEDEITWYKIGADEILEERPWAGRYIPIVPVIGEQTVIEGRLDRKGHTRNLTDAQRMYNFWTSSAVEQVALQTKTKWFVPVGATENLESYYATINTQNYPFIPYNAMDTEGHPLPAPTPIEPPTMAEAFIKGMVIAEHELGMTSGQREENMAEPTNAISGKAINARQRQGENATYHFIDGLAVAIRQVGVIILDLAPHVYDTKQLRHIMAENGTEYGLQLDPDAKEVYTERPGELENSIIAILNPTIGKYWVDADVGPSYATRRQETWNALVQIISQNQDLVKVAGDVLFLAGDFVGSDEIARRLRRTIDPSVLGEGPDAAVVAMQEQNKQLVSLIAELNEKLAEQKLALKDKTADEKVDMFNAESNRLKQIDNAKTSIPDDMLPLIQKAIRDILGKEAPSQEADADGAPIPGAKKAEDGSWYVPNPAGGHYRVELGEEA